jgi:hypothetical protein
MWIWVFVITLIILWFTPSVQLFITDRFMDRQYEIPDHLNRGGVDRDGLDPSREYMWVNGRSQRVASTSQTPPKGT